MASRHTLEYPYADAVVVVSDYGQDRTGRWHAMIYVQSPDHRGYFVEPLGIDPFNEYEWSTKVATAASKHVQTTDEWLRRGRQLRIALNEDLSNGISPQSGDTSDTWPDIAPLPKQKPVPHLTLDLVPGALRGWVVDVADRACFPLEFVGVPATVALGGLVGRTMGVKPTRYDDFIVVPNVWGGLEARPGMLKTFAISEGMRPISDLVAIAQDRYEAEMSLYKAEAIQMEVELAAIEGQLRQEARKHSNRGVLESLKEEYARKSQEVEQSVPIKRRYMTQDITVEKLGVLLKENPRGILVVRDELAGWLRTLDKPGREGDREFYLESWNGTESFTFDRIGRGEIYIPAVCVSICGGIQPAKLKRYISDAITESAGADGLLQRFQLLVSPDELGPWTKPERWPDRVARERAFSIYRWLDSHIEGIEASYDERRGIRYMRFSREAQEVADAWRGALESRLRGNELEPYPAFESHMAKYRSLMPSLALLFHLVDIAEGKSNGPVSLEATHKAMLWCDFLEAHAQKIYSQELEPGRIAAHLMADKILSGKVVDGQSVRSAYEHHWSGLDTQREVSAALGYLAGFNWVRLVSEDTGGRPSEVIRIHPALRDRKKSKN